jgi:hypothetical protein
MHSVAIDRRASMGMTLASAMPGAPHRHNREALLHN